MLFEDFFEQQPGEDSVALLARALQAALPGGQIVQNELCQPEIELFGRFPFTTAEVIVGLAAEAVRSRSFEHVAAGFHVGYLINTWLKLGGLADGGRPPL